MFFKKRSQIKDNTTQTDDGDDGSKSSDDNNKEASKVGSSIAKLITAYCNSQDKPGKVYIFNRRVHHGGVDFARII